MFIHFINILTIVIASFASEYFYAKYKEKKNNKNIIQRLIIKDSIYKPNSRSCTIKRICIAISPITIT